MARFWTAQRTRTVGYGLLPGVLLCLPLVAAAHPVTPAARVPVGDTRAWARAWPMVGHDPQRTYRSASSGPLHARLLLSVRTSVDPPLIDPDGSLYGWSYN